MFSRFKNAVKKEIKINNDGNHNTCLRAHTFLRIKTVLVIEGGVWEILNPSATSIFVSPARSGKEIILPFANKTTAEAVRSMHFSPKLWFINRGLGELRVIWDQDVILSETYGEISVVQNDML